MFHWPIDVIDDTYNIYITRDMFSYISKCGIPTNFINNDVGNTISTWSDVKTLLLLLNQVKS